MSRFKYVSLPTTKAKIEKIGECRGRKTDKPWSTPHLPTQFAVCTGYRGQSKLIRYGSRRSKRFIPSNAVSVCKNKRLYLSYPKADPRYWESKLWKCKR